MKNKLIPLIMLFSITVYTFMPLAVFAEVDNSNIEVEEVAEEPDDTEVGEVTNNTDNNVTNNITNNETVTNTANKPVIHSQVVNYFTTVQTAGRLISQENTSKVLEHNQQSEEIAGNYTDEAVVNVINAQKNVFTNWVDDQDGTDVEVTSSEILNNYYYDVHTEVTELTAAECAADPDKGDIDPSDGCLKSTTVMDKHQTYRVNMSAKDWRLTEVNITVVIPTIGTEITMDGDDWDTQRPQATITMPNGAHYELDSYEDENYMYYPEHDDFNSPFTGKFEKSKKYMMEIWIRTLDNFIVTDNTVVKINGTVVPIEYQDEDILEVYYEFTPQARKYSILSGGNQTIKRNQNLEVKTNGDLDDLVDILVDGVKVPKKYCTLTKGSTILNLSAEYLNTLSTGVHKLTFVYDDASVDTTFIIEDETNNPQTSDNIYLWIITMFISILGIVGSTTVLKKDFKLLKNE